ncbi:aspartate:alanine exchanger family transporter [Rubritalea sp.]|uniref:aspartate:alanine exchanger family transporter n=1 Tax=Rubritalea sp. TaxID=2109375 RepID=UPI003EF10740
METVHLLFSSPLFCLFSTLSLGLILGNIRIGSFRLGSAAVLFIALIVGHFGYVFPTGVGSIGLVLFIYSVGIAAGGRFFSALRKEGLRPVILALVTMGSGGLIIYLGQQALGLPKDIAIGIYAGAMSSAPALAAGAEALGEAQGIVVGYGLAYPLGIVGIILFVQVIPKLLFSEKIEQEVAESQVEEEVLQNILVEICNPTVIGKNIADFGSKHLHGCQIARRLEGQILHPLAYEDSFHEGQHILMVGRAEDLEIAIELLGKRSERRFIRDIEQERKTLQIHNKDFCGKTIRELQPLKNYGVLITRITRYGLTFVPEREEPLEIRDNIRVIGRPDAIKKFADAIMHQSGKKEGTEILSISLGITLGIFLGMIPFSLPGTESITLGLAGGPLIVALLFGHFGHIGSLETHIPREPRLLLQNLGLVFFISAAGVKGGAAFLETFQQYGIALVLLGLLITLGSMVATIIVAAYFMKMSPLSALGALCGSMTSTPGLGALTSKFSSQTPLINYATIYPVALIIITITIKVLVGMF